MLNQIKKHRKSIMGVGALLILVFHYWNPIFINNKILSFIEHIVISYDFIGVDIMLLLSGIGLVNSINKNSIKSYYKHRITRIIIPCVLTDIIYCIYHKWSLKTFIFNITGITFYFYNASSFLWFIHAIVTLYILFPIYYIFYKNRKNKILSSIISILIWFVLVKIFENNIREDLFIFINRIPVFLIGVLLGQMLIENKDYNNRLIIIIASVILLIFGGYEMHLCYDYNHYLLVKYSYWFIPAICLTLFVVVISAYIFEKLKILDNIFSWLGSISLELYCCQVIINIIISPYLKHITDLVLIQNILKLIVIIIVSWLFATACNYIKKLITKKY